MARSSAPASKRSSVSAAKDDATAALVEKQTAIQRRQDAKDRTAVATKKSKRAVQAGTRVQPVELPPEHQTKPGDERDMALRPRFTAPG